MPYIIYKFPEVVCRTEIHNALLASYKFDENVFDIFLGDLGNDYGVKLLMEVVKQSSLQFLWCLDAVWISNSFC